MPLTRVALIRGINVGRAKRVAMADLRAMLVDLGFARVRTVLNSGNAIFDTPDDASGDIASRIEEAMKTVLGVPARVTALTAEELGLVVAENPLLSLATDPSRLMVAVAADPADLLLLEPLAARDWAPEALAVGSRAAYLWCPAGVIASRLFEAVGRALGEAVTTRNWATTTKLLALCDE